MTHPIYSQSNLEALTINRLKEIASQLGIKQATDARLKKSWGMAIINHQARLFELVESLPHITLLADRVSDSIADTIETLEEERDEMVPLPPSAAPQPLIPILAIVIVILALSIVIMPLALLISIPLVFRRSSSSSVRIPKISPLI